VLAVLLGSGLLSAQQDSSPVSNYFEGKQVTVKLDMPATQQGIDIFPQRGQPLDLKSYSGRIKKYGVSIRNGDSVLVTKVKVKDNNVEFQLAGGGYGTAWDDTDDSVHYIPLDKSGREKNLEDELKNETDPQKRKEIKRELDDARAARERRDNRDRAAAEQAADSKRQTIDNRRAQGGSRFNIRLDRQSGTPVTPEYIMSVLSKYVAFPPDMGAPAGETTRLDAVPRSGNEQPAAGGPAPPPPASSADPAASLRKGLTRDQVEALFGPAVEAHDSEQNGLKMTVCSYRTGTSDIRANFVNGVLVQYTVSSR
jgi:hypothetical protein